MVAFWSVNTDRAGRLSGPQMGVGGRLAWALALGVVLAAFAGCGGEQEPAERERPRIETAKDTAKDTAIEAAKEAAKEVALAPAGSKTLEEAMMRMAEATERGDLAAMMAMTHYSDEEATTTAFQLEIDLDSLRLALTKTYGQEVESRRGGFGGMFPSAGQIENGPLSIVEEGDKATVTIPDAFDEEQHFIRKEGLWYLDMAVEAREGPQRERLMRIMTAMSDTVKEARGKIGAPGVTVHSIEMELAGTLASAAAGMSRSEATPPPAGYATWEEVQGKPLSLDDPLVGVVREFMDASLSGDDEGLREVVAEECRAVLGDMTLPYWQVYNEHMRDAVQEQPITADVEAVEVLEQSAEQVTLRVTATSSDESGVTRATFRDVLRNMDGRWMLIETAVEQRAAEVPGASGAGMALPELPDSAYEPAAVSDEAVSEATKAAFGSEARKMEFPANEVVAGIYVRDWGAPELTSWERFGDGQHRVVIPAGKEVKLVVSASDLSFMANIEPGIVHTLRIMDPAIDDAQLEHVMHLAGLKAVDLRETQVSETGVAKLRVAFPDCSIRDQ